MSILELTNVSYRAGGRLILDRVNWQVEPGQHWAILGANGAGKTTLLKIACGYLWPNSGGEVTRLGQRLLDLRELRKSIGWVTLDMPGKVPADEPALDTVVSGRFAQVGLRRKLLRDELHARLFDEAREQLAALGADSLAAQAFGTLSQGERQKVLIARARMAKPLVIFLDEPCGGLDPGAREHLLAALEQLAQRTDDIALVLVTHHVEEIMPAFTNTLAMANGAVVAKGESSELLTTALMTQLYDVSSPQWIRSNGRVWPVW
ncbi:ABC transporter ATP-binding protein [Adhaeretor mobilis]|uniref:Putative ABC transporter ATP-binding protein YlmA n=1 Tax=Adhaeretor mobilis TaxID=1930276 RepID=A0A517MQ69_9BACT|nr:ATP-binding cassette domain-containing protein [Adhaeretor mobilis]QDS97035.1 putative ABC transporter ATP-binding protein YlmA [Adhaeretor mobilis]